MTYGVQTWDANGVPNNYGIKPICVVGFVNLEKGQQSGTYSYTLPPYFRIGYIVSTGEFEYTELRRKITTSSTTISVSSAESNTYGPGIYPADKSQLVIYMEKI